MTNYNQGHPGPYGMHQPGMPPPQMPYPPQPGMGYGQRPGNGLAVAGMVLGILGLLFFWIPFLNIIVNGVGLALSSAGLSRAGKIGGAGKGMAVAGLVCSLIGLMLSLWIVYAWIVIVQAAT